MTYFQSKMKFIDVIVEPFLNGSIWRAKKAREVEYQF
jgi:hypothetical protein